MKLMGVDFGLRRIGVAVTDETGLAIRGLPTIDCMKAGDTVAAISELATKQAPEKIIFGVPLGPDDEETKTSQRARDFAAKVHARTGLPVEFIDESFSSQNAEQLLRSQKKKRRRDKAAVDRIAACLILQEYQKEFPPESW